MAPIAPRLPAGSVIQHYEVIRPLGTGGMGTVLLARDTRLGRLVAIKLLARQSEQGVRRFLIEARATAQISHENIVVIHDVGEHDGTPYMVLEYLKGRTLGEVLRERRGRRREQGGSETGEERPGSAGEETGDGDGVEASSDERGAGGLPAGRAVELMIPVVRALVCAHGHGIVHRDLKPSNVLVTDTGVVKVLDFGIAKLLGGPEAAADEGAPPEVIATEASPPGLTGPGALLGTRPYMAPEQWRAGQVDHRTDIWAAGVLLAELVLGEHPLAPLTPYRLATIGRLDVPMPSLRALRPDLGKLASIIDRCLIKRMEDRLGSAGELLAELEALAPAARPSTSGGDDDERNPFAGLSAFQEADASRFFGRSAAVAEVVAQLAEQPLLAIVGPSGAGKSSFVRAGVIPALERAGEAWEAFTIRPGPRPMAALAELVLADVLHTSTADEEREALIAKLRVEPGLLGARMRALCRRRLKRGLLFVDQMEELYTLAPRQDRAAFLACLGGVAADVGSPLRAVLAIRSDFLDRMAKARATLGALRGGIVRLPPMDREGLREALVRPLEAVEHRFEPPELVDEMLDALEHTPAALALLSFTAARLWEQRDRARRVLTEESYRRMGGIGGALAGHADAVLEAMSAEERSLAQTALLRLVTPVRTRAVCTMAELRELAPVASDMDRVLGRLIDARLLAVAGRGEADATVQIVHHSLISGWPTLIVWLAASQEDALFLSRLRNAAIAWETGGCSEDLLWRGQTAEVARQWRQRYSGELSQRDERYLGAVIDLAGRARRRRWRLIAGEMAALGVIATVVSILATRAGELPERAQDEARQARNATRMAVARELESDPTTALALLREVEPPDVPRGWSDLARRMLHAGVARVVLQSPRQDQVFNVSAAWSPDGKHILGSYLSFIAVWRSDGPAEPVLLRDIPSAGRSGRPAAWSPDGKRIVIADLARIARVWSIESPTDPLLLAGHEHGITSVAWSPDGERIVTTSSKTARVWSADGAAAPTLLRGHRDMIESAAWSPDGKRIVTASRDGTARVWSADGEGAPVTLGHGSLTGSPPRYVWGANGVIFRGHDEVQSAAWSPDGERIVTASTDGTARVWSADGAAAPTLLSGHRDMIESAAWSPDGERIVTASTDGTARVWSADGEGSPVILRGHEGEVRSAAWSPDGKRIVTASDDRTARVWSADGKGAPVLLRGHGGPVGSAAWSPDGKRIVTASSDPTARVWSADAIPDPLLLRGHESDISSAAWSPDGKRIITSSSDDTALVWSADGTGDPLILRAHDGVIDSPEWSPDGDRILTYADARTVRVWDADGTGDPLVLRGHKDGIIDIAWSPEGKRILAVWRDGTALVWSAGSAGHPVVLHHKGEMMAAWSPDGERILTWAFGNAVRVWSADGTGDPVLLSDDRTKFTSAAWSPDSKRIVTVSTDDIVRVWNADGTGDPTLLNDDHVKCLSASWSPDGKRILSRSDDKSVRVCNADGTGDPLVLRGHEGLVRSAAWSPEGRRILTVSEDRTVRVWSADRMGDPLVLRGHDKRIDSAEWSPDGERIVTVSEDRTVRVWSADRMGDPLILRGDAPSGGIWFSPDGKRLAVSHGKTVSVWSDLDPLWSVEDPRLWTATNYCMPVERRIKLLGFPESTAQADLDTCLRRVAAARAPAP